MNESKRNKTVFLGVSIRLLVIFLIGFLLAIFIPPSYLQAAHIGFDNQYALQSAPDVSKPRPCLAVGVPFETVVSSSFDEGAVNIIYNEKNSLDWWENEFWYPSVLGMGGSNQFFGDSLAFGDFDGNGLDELAIGIPYHDVGTAPNAGSVVVLYARPSGYRYSGFQLWHQNQGIIPDQAEEDDYFGSSLAAGDFDGDGRDDLAIGVPYEEINGQIQAGAVHVLYGTDNGLTDNESDFWNQDVGSIGGDAEFADTFGYSLATGDFNHDGFDDLAIGIPGKSISHLGGSGQVLVIYGSNTGLVDSGNQRFSQDTDGIEENIGYYDQFGETLASGDFNGDSYDDLAIGVPYEDLDGTDDAGVVHILPGSASRLTATGSQIWSQASTGVEGDPEYHDFFGMALAAGDFNNDDYDDLAIGIPGEDIGVEMGAGAVLELKGSHWGITAEDSFLWSEAVNFVAGEPHQGDYFGRSLAAADFNLDGYDDLAVGAPQGTESGLNYSGSVVVIYGYFPGLFVLSNELFTQNTPGILDTSEIGDFFGGALAASEQCAYAQVRVFLPVIKR